MTGDDSAPQDLNITDKQTGAQFTVTGENLRQNHRLTGAVPIEELEALADAWELPENSSNSHTERLECAQELRELVAEYE